MTQDHIFPKAYGGPDTLVNLQTMCSKCNGKKGCKFDLTKIYKLSEECKYKIHASLNSEQILAKVLILIAISKNYVIDPEILNKINYIDLNDASAKDKFKLSNLLEIIKNIEYVE